MIAEVHNKLGNPQKLAITRLVLRSDAGEPICVAMEVGKDKFYVIHRGDGDEDMNRALRSMGIQETVISDVMDDELPTPPGTLWTPPGS